MQIKETNHNIIKCAVSYDIQEEEVINYLDMQIIVDFLILNRDRHLGNIGFLRDSNTLQLVSTAPIYDSGSCRFLEGELPESVEVTKVNGMYNTDMECLNCVSNWGIIDFSTALTADEIRQELEKSSYMSRYRKEKLLDLNKGRLSYLIQRQSKELKKMNSF